mmetsp:Transcript_59849/g.142575  ORF Transcript_59849/g.142575 Transcript_59849/m.142575 type:complete len:207 (+) Transcript_59849:801-1421(+)
MFLYSQALKGPGVCGRYRASLSNGRRSLRIWPDGRWAWISMWPFNSGCTGEGLRSSPPPMVCAQVSSAVSIGSRPAGFPSPDGDSSFCSGASFASVALEGSLSLLLSWVLGEESDRKVCPMAAKCLRCTLSRGCQTAASGNHALEPLSLASGSNLLLCLYNADGEPPRVLPARCCGRWTARLETAERAKSLGPTLRIVMMAPRPAG